MKRKTLSFLLCLLFLSTLVLNVSAASDLPLIIDNANLLSNVERNDLESTANEIRAKYGMDVVILTVDTLGNKSAQDYADDYYDRNGYADDGVLFLLAMEEREWYISTCGDAIYAVTDYGAQQLGDAAVWHLSDGDYYGGFGAYLEELPEYFEAHRNGDPIDGYAEYSDDYYHGDREEVVYYDSHRNPSILISLLIGLVVAAVVILIMRAQMNTKRPQRSAGSYLKRGSYHLHTHQDMFLYSNVHRVRRQQNNSSGGGGSSVHHSSSGRSHGGGGGRF